MFSRSFVKSYKGVSVKNIWETWSDVESWPKWDKELDYCSIDGDFESGTLFILKPKKGPKVEITLYDVLEEKAFSDFCKFPGATMYDIHEIEPTLDGVKIKNTIYMKGPLSFIWWFLVGKNVSKSIEGQTNNLVEYVRKINA